MAILLEQFDADTQAVICAAEIIRKKADFPAVAVTTFSTRLIDALCKLENTQQIGKLGGSYGFIPTYKTIFKGTPIAFYLSLPGAPAAIIMLEEMVAKGMKKLVAFGSCGVLEDSLADGCIILPSVALRDEGTSYHYAAPTDEISMDACGIEALESALTLLDLNYVKGKTWTTDALYRETRRKVQTRKDAGCLCVEMECAAFIAACRFLEVPFAQFLYAADSLDAAQWEPRGLANGGLEGSARYLSLALETAIRM